MSDSLMGFSKYYPHFHHQEGGREGLLLLMVMYQESKRGTKRIQL